MLESRIPLAEFWHDDEDQAIIHSNGLKHLPTIARTSEFASSAAKYDSRTRPLPEVGVMDAIQYKCPHYRT